MDARTGHCPLLLDDKIKQPCLETCPSWPNFPEKFSIKLIYLTKFAIVKSMRLNKIQIEHLAFSIVKGLVKDNVIITEDKDSLAKQIEEITTRELLKEDQLDEQVKEILKNKLDEIRNTNIDYYEMFKMVKSKLAEKENIVI